MAEETKVETNESKTTTPVENAEETSWRDGLSEELRSSHVLAKYDSAEGAFKALIGAQELLGRKGLVAPTDGAPQEQIDAYRAARRNGVVAPEAYSLKMSDKDLEEIGIGKDELDSFRKQAFAAGLDADAFNALMGEVANERKATIAEKVESANALVAKLSAEWGGEAETDKRLARGAAFINKFPGLMDAVSEAGLGGNEAFVRFIDEMSAKAFGERTLPKPSQRESANPMESIATLRKSGIFEKFDSPERSKGLDEYKRNIEVMRQKAAQSHGRLEF